MAISADAKEEVKVPRNAAAKEEVKVPARCDNEPGGGRTVSCDDPQTLYLDEVIINPNPNLVKEPVQACGGSVAGEVGDMATLISMDKQKTAIPNKGPKKVVVTKKGKNRKAKQNVVVPVTSNPILGPILGVDIPEPIATLNINNLLKSYKGCVKAIIRKVKKESRQKFIFVNEDGKERCVPVTLGPDESPSGVNVIKLTDGENNLRVVAQKHQNWFRGFITTNGGRFEIDGMEPKIMARSKSLYTSSRYYDLLGTTVDECMIGYYSLIQSFYTLAKHPEQNQKQKYEEAIAVLLVMLFEAARFPAVFQKARTLLREKKEDTVGVPLKELINNWSDTSRDFYMANGEEGCIILTDKTNEKIRKVAMSVSLLCGSRWIEWQEANSKKEVKLGTGKPWSGGCSIKVDLAG